MLRSQHTFSSYNFFVVPRSFDFKLARIYMQKFVAKNPGTSWEYTCISNFLINKNVLGLGCREDMVDEIHFHISHISLSHVSLFWSFNFYSDFIQFLFDTGSSLGWKNGLPERSPRWEVQLFRWTTRPAVSRGSSRKVVS